MDSVQIVKRVTFKGKKYTVKSINYINPKTSTITSRELLIFEGEKPVNLNAKIKMDDETFSRMEANPDVLKGTIKELVKATFPKPDNS